MAPVTLFDLLGIADGADLDAAVARWPAHLVQGGVGLREHPDPNETRALIQFLQGALEFRSVRPGADPEQVGLTAELLVVSSPTPLPLVLTALPDVEFHLQPTGAAPARIAVISGDLGTELVVEALPVEIRLPTGLLQPLGPADGVAPTEETPIDGFIAGLHDTLRVVLRRTEPSSIFVHLKVRMTVDGAFVVEPAVPLSVGPCRFSGLPCRAIHDLNLFPSPMLGIGPGRERHFGDQALEWIRHPLVDEDVPEFGVITVRSVDLDDTRPPLGDLRDKLNPEAKAEREFEWVVEDLAFPIGAGPFPVPSHFLAGLRRELRPGDDPNGAYNLGGLAIPLDGPARILPFEYLVIEQLLLRSVPSAALDAPTADRQFAFFQLALVDDPAGTGHGATIDLTDEWTVLAGWRHQPGLELFTLFGARFLLLGARIGLSLQRVSDGRSVFESGVLVGDLNVTFAKKGDAAAPGVVKLQGEATEPKGVVVHDFGLRFGKFQLGSFWKTGGATLKAFDVISLEIEEFGLVTEPSGALYFGFSGSIPLPANKDAGKPVTSSASAGSTGKVENGVGFRFYRLRGKVSGAEEAPSLLIDGIGLSIRYGKVGITGFGMLSEYESEGHRYKEAGLSLEVSVPVAGIQLVLGGLFFHGRVSGPVHNFTYWMIGLKVSPIPIGPVTLTDVQLLFAWNLAPALGQADAGAATPMRLFQWYKSHKDAVALPSNRNVGAGGWAPADESYAAVAAAKVSIGSRAFVINAFFLYMNTGAGNGLLIGFEITFLKSPKPIAYAALEMDGDRWSVLAGLSVGFENVIGRKVPMLSGVPFLTGTYYHTNKPGTNAVGQVLDPSTWLAVHLGGPKRDQAGNPLPPPKFDKFTFELFAGICIQVVDLPEGPRVFALRVSVSGGSRLFKVGGIEFYLTLELIAGVWRTESRVSGFVIWFEGGIEVDVFYVFDWGASVRVECDYLGPDPVHRRLSAEVRIHTPWWLPDVSFRWTRTSGESAMDKMRVLATPAVGAAARQLATPEPVELPALSPVAGDAIDPAALYGIGELAAADGSIPAALLAQLTPIGVDSSLALAFNVSMDDLLVFGQNTAPDLGADRSNDVATRYELVELGIRRRPRANGGAWSTLIDPAHSRVESLAGLTPEAAAERHRQIVPLRWDADFKREGKADTRRLLVNTDAPYWTAILDFEGDELLLQTEPGWPCCPPGAGRPRWHTIDFLGVPPGTRVPATQRFSESRSTLRWIIPPPVAGPGPVSGVPSVARMNGDTPAEAVFARLAFVEIAGVVELDVRWRPMHLNRMLVVRAFRGLDLLEERSFELSHVPPQGITLEAAEGISEIELALVGRSVDQPDVDFGWLEWVELRFRSVQERLGDLLTDGRCGAAPEGVGRPGGRFAWLPNHEYEVSFRTRVTARHERTGDLVREVPQRLVFRTRGLPGLNRAARVGEEFAPYVESAYPAPGRPLYRSEPVVLALNERSDVFRRPDPPRPADPAERQQQVDWVLAVSRVGGAGPVERISRPDADWIVAHRGTVPPPRPGRRPVDVGSVADVIVRRAMSEDPFRVRFEAVLASPSSCGATPEPPPSRALLHRPYDPAHPDATPALWPARSVLRAAAQVKAGPFVDRAPFEPDDLTALVIAGSGPWSVEEGALGVAAPVGAVALAIFGDAGWRTASIAALVDPRGAAAGVAAAVGGSPVGSTAVLFLVDEAAGRLRVIRRDAAGDTQLAAEPLPAGLAAPFTLEVSAYEDGWDAAVGETRVALPRDPAEQGRLAMAVRGPGRVRALRVEPLDLYRFEVVTSRYADFAAHIGSWPGRVAPLPEVVTATESVADLLVTTPIADLMRRGADPAERQGAFDRWTAGLGVPLRRDVERVELSRRASDDGTDLLLIEGPEPLPLTEDVRVRLDRVEDDATRTPVPLAVLTDATECRAYLVPLGDDGTAATLPAGEYELAWTLSRVRYRSAAAEPDAVCAGQAVLAFTL